MRLFVFLLGLLSLEVASPSPATTIGTAESGNCVPFGCMGRGPQPMVRYQQIYSGAEFDGPIRITVISFDLFPSISDIQAGATYRLSLSTTGVSVDGLSSAFGDNVGSDQQLFVEIERVVGLAPSLLIFHGTPFDYDPSLGNLLLDIEMVGITHPDGLGSQPNGAFYGSQHGTAVGIFSRVTDFRAETPADPGVGIVDPGWGLVTTFLPEPRSGILLGFGLAVLGHRRRLTRGCRGLIPSQ